LTHLVMQYVRRSPHQLLARAGRLPADRAMAIVEPRPRCTSRTARINHRDVKPGNPPLRSTARWC
jgi:hypothetical protein